MPFEVRIICEDKKLPKVMWALDGLILGPPQILPVRGGPGLAEEADTEFVPTPTKGPKKGTRIKPPGGTLPELALKELIRTGHKTSITPPLMTSAALAVGGSSNSYTYVNTYLRKHGLIVGPKADGTYTITDKGLSLGRKE